jgi:hypothetical protein
VGWSTDGETDFNAAWLFSSSLGDCVVIIWLASYPRSGNTLLRTMLWKAFQLKSYSASDDRGDLGAVSEVMGIVGHEFLPMKFDDFYESKRASRDLVLVKTHDKPIDAGRAIYVIRDGRSAIVSWYNMLVSLRKRNDVSISDVIMGRGVRFGDWSSHIRAWTPNKRPATLLLYYNDLVSGDPAVLEKLAGFIGIPQCASWVNQFSELQELMPDFFRRGSDAANLAQMTEQESDLFWETHEQCMCEYGFPSNTAVQSP